MALCAGPRVERRQSYCPRCESTRGVPLRVNANPHLVVITYRCEACGQQWNVPNAPKDLHFQLSNADPPVV